MSSGELPLEIYHRANAVGSGSYGSVVVVYDDEGQEYAMKLFDDDEEDEEDVDSSDYGINLGALREISILRLLKEENSHPNVIEIHDVQTAFGEEDDEEVGVYAMAMPLFPDGSLADAFSKITTKKQKAVIAHGILKAMAYLHENSIIHRDIKSDNVLLKFQTSDGDSGHGLFEPVVIDFSLAKFVSEDDSSEVEPTHTASIGTPTYRAPEVVDEKPYGLPSDLWSVGVVLLEMLQGKCFESFKDKGALKEIAQCLDSLPDAPFPTLLRGLLETDPSKRWTARQALSCDLFAKFNLSEEPESKSFHRISLSDALPIEGDESEDDCSIGKENHRNSRESKDSSTKKKKKVDPVVSKRTKFVQKVCDWMEWENPMTTKAAMLYISQMNEITGNVDDLNASNTMLDCLVLAHKFFERHLSGTSDLDTLYEKFGQGGFDADEYAGNENTIFEMMDFCLYPR